MESYNNVYHALKDKYNELKQLGGSFDVFDYTTKNYDELSMRYMLFDDYVEHEHLGEIINEDAYIYDEDSEKFIKTNGIVKYLSMYNNGNYAMSCPNDESTVLYDVLGLNLGLNVNMDRLYTTLNAKDVYIVDFANVIGQIVLNKYGDIRSLTRDQKEFVKNKMGKFLKNKVDEGSTVFLVGKTKNGINVNDVINAGLIRKQFDEMEKILETQIISLSLGYSNAITGEPLKVSGGLDDYLFWIIVIGIFNFMKFKFNKHPVLMTNDKQKIFGSRADIKSILSDVVPTSANLTAAGIDPGTPISLMADRTEITLNESDGLWYLYYKHSNCDDDYLNILHFMLMYGFTHEQKETPALSEHLLTKSRIFRYNSNDISSKLYGDRIEGTLDGILYKFYHISEFGSGARETKLNYLINLQTFTNSLDGTDLLPATAFICYMLMIQSIVFGGLSRSMDTTSIITNLDTPPRLPKHNAVDEILKIEKEKEILKKITDRQITELRRNNTVLNSRVRAAEELARETGELKRINEKLKQSNAHLTEKVKESISNEERLRALQIKLDTMNRDLTRRETELRSRNVQFERSRSELLRLRTDLQRRIDEARRDDVITDAEMEDLIARMRALTLEDRTLPPSSVRAAQEVVKLGLDDINLDDF